MSSHMLTGKVVLRLMAHDVVVARDDTMGGGDGNWRCAGEVVAIGRLKYAGCRNW